MHLSNTLMDKLSQIKYTKYISEQEYVTLYYVLV